MSLIDLPNVYPRLPIYNSRNYMSLIDLKIDIEEPDTIYNSRNYMSLIDAFIRSVCEAYLQ